MSQRPSFANICPSSYICYLQPFEIARRSAIDCLIEFKKGPKWLSTARMHLP
ncbi:hypothetical protein COCHEDRAFT_1021915 [Bipolaris maydis C5]|uniref:Uncharacterized protein n=1 Tax=Cochliobolus heterostrophus (strain C5 / ATCC 48332 / race O) TaxID=701091 RepID=M2U762_COCH5|nr:hypothetical protein COCHEDRAFT_1021915 [Bipolaris maydis C5]